jgi:histidyl-tRNA synthetase
LKYDQTVPLARVIAQYGTSLPSPFRRYQIQPVWRAEKPQKGRFREFLQCDADIVGNPSYIADCELIVLAAQTLTYLGFTDFRILVNDRTILEGVPRGALRSLDKLDKIGEAEVRKELRALGLSESLLDTVRSRKPTESLTRILETAPEMGVPRDTLRFVPTLARGLDYYTGMIFEVVIEGYGAGSVCGGGRYDRLIGQFTGVDVPAVGFAFGFDRLLEAMDERKLLPSGTTTTKLLITVFEPKMLEEALYLTTRLRNAGINTEIAPVHDAKLDRQLKYADTKGIPFAVIQGPAEAADGKILLKNLKMHTQDEMTVETLIEKFTQSS